MCEFEALDDDDEQQHCCCPNIGCRGHNTKWNHCAQTCFDCGWGGCGCLAPHCCCELCCGHEFVSKEELVAIIDLEK